MTRKLLLTSLVLLPLAAPLAHANGGLPSGQKTIFMKVTGKTNFTPVAAGTHRILQADFAKDGRTVMINDSVRGPGAISRYFTLKQTGPGAWLGSSSKPNGRGHNHTQVVLTQNAGSKALELTIHNVGEQQQTAGPAGGGVGVMSWQHKLTGTITE